MVYKERFVAVVKCGGRILREMDETVTLPFGSTYSLLLKNMESRKADVTVSIDGQDVLYGKSLIVEPNEEFELERFLENLDQGNKFKFIQKTKKIVDHRGDKIDDGLIRIEFAFEQKVIHEQINRTFRNNYHYHYSGCRPFTCSPSIFVWETDQSYEPVVTYDTNPNVPNSVGSSGGSVESNANANINSYNCSMNDQVQSTPTINEPQINIDEGITVQGGQSNQQFYQGNIGLLEQSSVIIIKLRGETSKGKVKKSITVKSKLECPNCGTKSKSNVKFCPECGTNLT